MPSHHGAFEVDDLEAAAQAIQAKGVETTDITTRNDGQHNFFITDPDGNRIEMMRKEVEDYYGSFRVTTDLIELRNLVQAAELIVRCALERKESRGLHFTLDHPQTDSIARDSVLLPR